AARPGGIAPAVDGGGPSRLGGIAPAIDRGGVARRRRGSGAPAFGRGGAAGLGRPRRLDQGAAGLAGELGDHALFAQRHGGGGLLAVVEVVLGRSDDLVVLVALAGDHHDVAGDGLADGGADRARAID